MATFVRRITPLKADFVIAGAGVIGLATAWELHRSGASVVVLDRGLAGREASWAGGGMLFPLSAWKYADAVTALTELGRKLYPEWVAELRQATNIDPEYRETGLVVLPPADFERARAWCAKRDLHANLMVGADLSPLLSVHPQALWLPLCFGLGRKLKRVWRQLRAFPATTIRASANPCPLGPREMNSSFALANPLALVAPGCTFSRAQQSRMK